MPIGYYKSIYNARVAHLYRGAPDPGIAGRQMDCPRGRVVGGSSSINGLIYIRGQHEDFDDWAALGADADAGLAAGAAGADRLRGNVVGGVLMGDHDRREAEEHAERACRHRRVG